MPKFTTRQEIKRFMLPSTKELDNDQQAWVDMATGKLVAGDLVGFDDVTSDIERSGKLLENRIRAWNFTDDTDAPMPITFENILQMDVNDFAYLASQFNLDDQPAPLTPDQKKS